MEEKQRLDIVNGSLWKNIFLFSIPLMFSQLIQILFNAADTIVVGKFAGDQALAAVGATGSLVYLFTALFFGLATGANVLIARYIGEGDEQKVSDAVHTSMYVAIAGGVILTFIGIFTARPFLKLMSTPEDILDQSVLYMQIYYAGVIFLMIYDFGSAILRSKGDTKRPLYFLAVSGVINILLNLFTVIVLHWAVAGVALATVASEAVSAVLVFITLMKDNDATKLDPKKIKVNGAIVKEIMRIGIPAGISGIVFSLSNIVIQSSINSFNDTGIVAGNSIGANIEGFVYIGTMAFSQAAITFTSQCYGARRYDRIRPITWICVLFVAVIAGGLGFALYARGDLFLQLYTNDPKVIEYGMIRTYWVARLLLFNGILDIFVSSMRGLGHSSAPTVIMLAGICGVRFAWLWIVFPRLGTLASIYMCFPVSWIITTAVEFILWIYICRKTLKLT